MSTARNTASTPRITSAFESGSLLAIRPRSIARLRTCGISTPTICATSDANNATATRGAVGLSNGSSRRHHANVWSGSTVADGGRPTPCGSAALPTGSNDDQGPSVSSDCGIVGTVAGTADATSIRSLSYRPFGGPRSPPCSACWPLSCLSPRPPCSLLASSLSSPSIDHRSRPRRRLVTGARILCFRCCAACRFYCRARSWA